MRQNLINRSTALYLALLLSPLFLLTSVNSLHGQDATVKKLIDAHKKENLTMEHLDILSNRIGGRVVGSAAYTNATYWVAELLKEWGLEVEVIEVGEVAVGFNRGPWFGRVVGAPGEPLHFVTPSYSAGTKGVQRGHVLIEPQSTREFEQMKGKLKGAWILVGGWSNGSALDRSAAADEMRAAIIEENDEIVRYNSTIRAKNRERGADQQLPYKELKSHPALFYKEMVEAGILGTIQSAPVPLRAMYDKETFRNGSWDNLPTCPDIKLSHHQYNRIKEQCEERTHFLLEFEIRNHFTPMPVKYHNVIATLRGSKYPHQYVMSGGHLDAFDVATGAVDCGTGVAPNLEAARLLSLVKAKPKRSIRFCFWAAEEFNLIGSRHWVESNIDSLHLISNYFNRDLGPTVTSSITVPPAMYEPFKRATSQLSSIDPRFPFTLIKREGPPLPRPTPEKHGDSDYAWFMIKGAPALSFTTSDPLGHNFYYNEIWHTERDNYNMSIPEYMEHSAVVTAIVVYNLANEKELLSREGLYAD